MLNICEKAFAKLPPEEIDHYESDLYIKVTAASRELIAEYDYKNLVTVFIDNIDRVPWYEIPFAWTGNPNK